MTQSSIIPLKACSHHGSAVRNCADCKVRLVSICSALSPPELEEIEAISQKAHFPRNEILATQGEPAASVYTVTEGVVRLYRALEDGSRQILGFALPGDFLGLSLVDVYGFSANAVTDTIVCRFPRDVFVSYVERRPHVMRRLHEFASHELGMAQDQMVLLGRRTAEERVGSFLIMIRNKLRRLGYTSPSLQIPMSRQDIADYLGLTIETVSRTFTKLVKAKTILIVPEGVRILRERDLERLATACSRQVSRSSCSAGRRSSYRFQCAEKKETGLAPWRHNLRQRKDA
jgi:CRP/FNR family transcriptional regulator